MSVSLNTGMTRRDENETLALASRRGLFHEERVPGDQRISDQPMNNRLKPTRNTRPNQLSARMAGPSRC